MISSCQLHYANAFIDWNWPLSDLEMIILHSLETQGVLKLVPGETEFLGLVLQTVTANKLVSKQNDPACAGNSAMGKGRM